MISVEKVRELVEERLEGTDRFIVNIEVKPGNKILVEIDGDTGISIKDCVSVSRQVEHNLDREAEDFELKVTSPGVGQPLKLHRQYVNNIGRSVNITTLDGQEYEGQLLRADDKGVELLVKTKEKQGKTKKRVEKNIPLPFEEIKQTKVVVSFNK